MSRLPFPKPDLMIMDEAYWVNDSMRDYAAASTAELRAELLREHADHMETLADASVLTDEIERLQARVRELENALREIRSGNCPYPYATNDASLLAYHNSLARAALKENGK